MGGWRQTAGSHRPECQLRWNEVEVEILHQVEPLRFGLAEQPLEWFDVTGFRREVIAQTVAMLYHFIAFDEWCMALDLQVRVAYIKVGDVVDFQDLGAGAVLPYVGEVHRSGGVEFDRVVTDGILRGTGYGFEFVFQFLRRDHRDRIPAY